MAEKVFYTMGEAAEMFDVNPSLLRYWETQFSILRPKRNRKGNRLYSRQDIEHLKSIYHLVKERGMTLEGAKRALKQSRSNGGAVERDAELMERLQRIRAMLVEVREDLKADDDAVRIGEMLPETQIAQPPTSPAHSEGVTDAPASVPAPSPEGAPQKSVRRPRRKRDDEEHKELFAFYEQSLF